MPIESNRQLSGSITTTTIYIYINIYLDNSSLSGNEFDYHHQRYHDDRGACQHPAHSYSPLGVYIGPVVPQLGVAVHTESEHHLQVTTNYSCINTCKSSTLIGRVFTQITASLRVRITSGIEIFRNFV